MNRIAYTPGMTLDEPLIHAEVYGTNPQRTSNQAGSSPADIQLLNVDLGVEARHVVIHDVHNVGWWANAPGVAKDRTLYNVTVYNVGWKGKPDGDRPDGGHGQALYTQNYADGGTRAIDTCVFLAGFSLPGKVYGTNSEVAGGWQLGVNIRPDGNYDLYPLPVRADGPFDYTSPRNKLANYTARRSVFVDERFIVGNEGKSAVGAHNIHFDECAFLNCWLQMGYQGDNGDGSIKSSFFCAGFAVQTYEPRNGEPRPNLGIDQNPITRMQAWAEFEFALNDVIIPRGASVKVVYPGLNWKWDYNTYWSEEEKPFRVTLFKGFYWLPGDPFPRIQIEQRALTFAEWQALTGFDAHSTYHDGLPALGYSRVYDVPEKQECIMWEWNATGAQRPATGKLYPPPPMVNWEGEPPNAEDPRIGIWREPIAVDPELDCSEVEAALALALADAEAMRAEIEALKQTIADREQRIREDADVIRSLQAQVVELQSEGQRDKQIADAWRVLMGVNHA